MYLDIKKIKQQVSIMQIIRYYGIELKQRNHNAWSGACPIHKGNNKNAFHVDTNKNVFYCFTQCAAGGNVIDFVMKMQNLSLYQAALWLNNNFINNNISYSLINNTDKANQYLKNRNINPSLAQYFDLQYHDTGPLKQRISISIHDEFGNYVSSCGRAISENVNPKYLFIRCFEKSKYLYNFHRVANSGGDKCFIVEGFFDVFFLTRLGYKAIALMGCSIYPRQIELLKTLKSQLILMPDGDMAGAKAMLQLENTCKENLLDYKCIYLPSNAQPENCTEEFLKEHLK